MAQTVESRKQDVYRILSHAWYRATGLDRRLGPFRSSAPKNYQIEQAIRSQTISAMD